MSEILWVQEENILKSIQTNLFNVDRLHLVWPCSENTLEQNVNNLSRLVIYLTILGCIFIDSFKFILSGIFTLAFLVVFYNYLKKKSKESFINDLTNSKKFKDKKDNIYHPVEPKNPMGNVLITDYVDQPNRPAAPPAYEKNVEENINLNTKEMVKSLNANHNKDDLTKKLFKDLGDNFKFEESMINFHTNPNTTIPNDQDGFAKFCYGDMPSCKEGNEFACAKKDLRYINY